MPRMQSDIYTEPWLARRIGHGDAQVFLINVQTSGGIKMLVNMNEVLLPAKKHHYAVGLFNAVNLELARGIIAAAESTGSPVIMGTAEVLLPYGPLGNLHAGLGTGLFIDHV